MRAFYAGFVVCLVALMQSGSLQAAGGNFERAWVYASETSAVIYWQLGDIASSANSFVEYGQSRELRQTTAQTTTPRWSQFHRLTGLDPDTTYFYRMVVVDSAGGNPSRSEIRQFSTHRDTAAVRIPASIWDRPPYILDRPDTRYILDRDIICDGTAFVIQADNVTLDLDGHTAIFGDNTDEMAYGVSLVNRDGKTVIANGRLVQGRRSKEYSAAISSLLSPMPVEIFGIGTDVSLRCTLPIDLTVGPPAEIHHNNIYSRVTELISRHQPGNTLLLVGGDPIWLRIRNVHIHDNLLSEGCHRGIHLREVISTAGRDPHVEVDHNDIRHHQQYVNGYAIIPSAGSDIHHNRITSTGRAIHIQEPGIKVHDNYIDTRGHMHLSDVPPGFRPFFHRLIELHGIKFEGSRVNHAKVYDNFVRVTQILPRDSDSRGDPADKMDNGVYVRSNARAVTDDRLVDVSQNWEADRWKDYWVKYSPQLPPALIDSNDATTLYGNFRSAGPGEYSIYMKWTYVPATPLNLACYDPNAMNEVYGNTFIGLTYYEKTRHGGYGDSGQWATGIMFVHMVSGPAEPGKYAAWVHDNKFMSNDLFLNSYEPVTETVRIENNEFTLLKKPVITDSPNRLRDIGAELEKVVRNGNNKLKE